MNDELVDDLLQPGQVVTGPRPLAFLVREPAVAQVVMAPQTSPCFSFSAGVSF